jgi:RHS repeat-associated protein
MAMSGTATSGLGFSGAATNRDTSGTVGYDAAGNAISVYNGISRPTFTYDAEGRMLTANSGSASYTYDANGNRVRKDAGGTWTEYLYFDGQPLAEKNADGTWSDYIYVNGQRIAKADGYDIRIHLKGTNCSNCGTNPNMFAGVTSLTPINYVIRNGDLLTWRQYQDGVTVGGIFFGCYDSNGNWVDGSSLEDTDGQPIAADTTKNSWHVRTVELSSFAGLKVASIDPFQWTAAPPGSWDIYFGDIVLVSTDGSFIPIYSRSMMTLGIGTNPTVSNFSAVTEKVADSSTLTTTTYYHGDQIGSEQMMTAGTGWPVSSYIYYPYGQGPAPGLNHYLFTGKERDQESGNDYFGARYYASTMGRFMTPDEPFADFDDTNPQSWNLYSYVRNNPLSNTDPDGNDCVTQTRTSSTTEMVSASSGECTGGSGNGTTQTYVPGTVTSVQAGQNGSSIDIGYTPYSDSGAGGVMNANSAPIPDNPGIAYGYNQAGFNQLNGLANFTNRYLGAVFNAETFFIGGLLGSVGPEITSLGLAGEDTYVIGKVADLDKGIGPGERKLDLPNQGNPKVNWAQNSSKLRQAMNEGRPIRDVSAGNPGSNTGFLRAERNLLQSHGWTLKGEYWVPPGR